MAEINFCDRTICITDVSLVSWRSKVLIKFTHRGIPVAFSSRGESVRNFVARISRARSGLLIDRERGTCQWATIISIIWLSGENGAWTKKIVGKRSRQTEWLEWSTSRRSKATFRPSTFRDEKCLSISNTAWRRKDRKKAPFPETRVHKPRASLPSRFAMENL